MAKEIKRKAARTPQEREAAKGCNHCGTGNGGNCGADLGHYGALRSLVREEVRSALLEIGPLLARIAAADTVRDPRSAEAVLRQAVAEGDIARRLLAARVREEGGAE